MSIVTSVIDSQVVQKDSRIAVVERHTDNIALTYQHLYLASAADNLQTNLSAYAIILAANLVNAEIFNDLASIQANGATAIVTTNYATLTQVINAVLVLFAISTANACLNLSSWLNTLTFGQLFAANSTKFPNVTSFNNWRAAFVTPGVNANATVQTLVGG